MDNYEGIHYKILNIINEATENGVHYDELKKEEPKLKTINYIKNKPEYIIDNFNTYLTGGNVYKSYSVKLNHFPENILPFIKVIPIVSTETIYVKELEEIATMEDLPSQPAGWENEITYSFLAEPIKDSEELSYTLKVDIDLDGEHPTSPVFQINVEIKLLINIPKEYNS
jgi:hypothetical protein